MEEKQTWIHRPENIFLIISLLVGSFLVILTPIGAGFDEDTHVARIWEMSNFEFIPNRFLGEGPHFPQAFYELSYRQTDIIRPVGMNFYQENANLKIDWDNMINHQTRSIYFPLLYLPQAFIMGVLGRILNTPILVIYFALRLSYLVLYVLLTYLAIKIIPFGKYILCGLALAPMALIQASIVSVDAISNGVSFLFFAWVFSIRDKKDQTISKKEILVTWLMVALLAIIKINSLILLFLLFLIPRNFFQNRKTYLKFWIIAIMIVVILCGGWNVLTIVKPSGETGEGNFSLINAQSTILGDLPTIINSLGEDLKIHGSQYIREWIGVFGYGYWNLPGFVYIFYPILLIILLCIESSTDILNGRQRILMIFLFGIGALFIFAIFQIIATPSDNYIVSGVQGRYFIPLSPLLFFALISSQPILKLKNMHKNRILVCCASILGIAVLFSALLVYHVNCGSSYYEKGLCYLPKYKNWAPDSNLSKPLENGEVYEQTFLSECNPIQELRIWINNSNPETAGKLQVSVYESNSKKEVFSEEINEFENIGSGWLTISFPAPIQKSGSTYQIYIYSQGLGPGIQLGLSSRDEYKEGELMINGELSNYDLLFNYGCSINSPFSFLRLERNN